MLASLKKLSVCFAILLMLIVGIAFFFRAPNAEQISKALSATIIPMMDLHQASLPECATFIADQFHRQHPEMRKVRLVLRDSSVMHPQTAAVVPLFNNVRITLSLSNIPASEAFRYVTSLANQGFAIRDGTIYVVSLGPTGKMPPLTMRERFVAKVEELIEGARGLFR